MSLTITAGAPFHSPRAAAAVTGVGVGVPPPHGYALSGKIMLSAIVVLFTVVLLILFVHLYVRWHVYRREARRQRRRSRLIFTAAADQASAAPRGLDPLVLKSLPVETFSASDELAGDVAECAVCLCEVDDGEKVRVLPRCGHRFHIDCIDMWFCTHSSCPLCRSAVEIDDPPTRCSDRAIGSSSDSRSEVSVEVPRSDEELGHKSRILAIKRFFSRDQRPVQDLERGEAAERSQSPPPPPAE